MTSALGEPTFVEDQDGEERVGLRRLDRRRLQGLLDPGAQFIAAAVLVPDGAGEQALHAVGVGLSGVFGDLPAILAGDVTENGLQIQQGMLAGFGARKTGGDALVQLE